MLGRGLVHNWADAMRFDDRPDEECDASHGDEKRFNREQMANLVHGEPDGWERAGPEEEEGEKIPRVCAGSRGHGIG